MSKKIKGCLLSIAFAFVAVPFSVNATMLTATMTVDNQYTVYISTNDSIAGTAFGSNSNWPTAATHTTALTNGVTNYLHIFAEDVGSPEMFIGQFSLDDAQFAFVNGAQSLLTNTSDWSGSKTGFGVGYGPLVDLGPDGTSPWGNFAAINDNARFIWSADRSICTQTGTDCTYFSTAIRFIGGGSGSVPEPGTISLIGVALAGFAFTRRKKVA